MNKCIRPFIRSFKTGLLLKQIFNNQLFKSFTQFNVNYGLMNSTKIMYQFSQQQNNNSNDNLKK